MVSLLGITGEPNDGRLADLKPILEKRTRSR